MSLDITLLRSTFALALERNPALTVRFYEILFTRYPEVRPLFSAQAKAHQPAKLAAALAGVVAHLDDAAWLDKTLGELGRRHVGYGVTREMYAPVGDSLLTAMGEALGADWTEDAKQQWVAAYSIVVDLMCPATAVTVTATEPAPVSASA